MSQTPSSWWNETSVSPIADPSYPFLALASLARRTLHMRSGSKAKQGRKEEIRAAALLPQHCSDATAAAAEEEEDKWTCPHRCVKPRLEAPQRAPLSDRPTDRPPFPIE